LLFGFGSVGWTWAIAGSICNRSDCTVVRRDGGSGSGFVNSDLVRSFVAADGADAEAPRRCARQSEAPGMQSVCRRLSLVKLHVSIDRFAACSAWALTGTNERRRHVDSVFVERRQRRKASQRTRFRRE